MIPDQANEGCPGLGSNNAGKQQSCKGCPNQKACSSGEITIDPDIQIIKQRLNNVKHKIMVLSGKGGVGKSTVSTQLAFTLAQKGFQVGLLDVDLCGPSVPRMTGLQGHQIHQNMQGWQPAYVYDNLAVMSIGFLLNSKNDAVIWRGPRKNGLIKQFLLQVNWGDLDYLVIDTPPGTSDQHLSLVQYLQPSKEDGAILVTTPQQVSIMDVRKQISFCLKTNVRILGVVQNMSGFKCPNCTCQYQIFKPNNGGALALSSIPLQPSVGQKAQKGQWAGTQTETGKQMLQMVNKLTLQFK